jgi:hypothetical protein
MITIKQRDMLHHAVVEYSRKKNVKVSTAVSAVALEVGVDRNTIKDIIFKKAGCSSATLAKLKRFFDSTNLTKGFEGKRLAEHLDEWIGSKPDKPKDMINSPSHYASGEVECIDAMVSAFGSQRVQEYAEIAAFKYNWRSNKKGNPSEDKSKAIWYLRYSMGDDPRKS